MDPISVALLVALAGGAGGEIGRQSWVALTSLVRRPFQREETMESLSDVGSGELELRRLEQAPADTSRAQALSVALNARAASDEHFRTELDRWYEQAKNVGVSGGEVHNAISGGTFNGPVMQGRDFSGITFPDHPESSSDASRQT
jgi:hypothetical protein